MSCRWIQQRQLWSMYKRLHKSKEMPVWSRMKTLNYARVGLVETLTGLHKPP